MSKVSGSKRKAAVASVQGEETGIAMKKEDSEDNLSTTIDREIEREMALIKSGQHPNVLEGLVALEQAKQKKIDASDRHRKMQIKNINALYEYEVEDATALYNKAYTELQEELIAELQSERNRQRMAAAEVAAKNKRSANQSTSAAAADTAANNNSNGGRSLRSSAPVNGDGAEAAITTSSASANMYGREYQYSRSNKENGAGGNASATSGTAGSSSGGARKRSGGASQGLDYTLPESTMRADFVDIVRDLHSRAAALERTKAKAPEREVRMSGDLSELFVSDESYVAGDLVVVFSVLSQESIHGIITSLTHRELVIKTPTGARFKVLVGQLRTGRVSLSKDRETLENAVVFNTAAEMQAAKEKVYSSAATVL